MKFCQKCGRELLDEAVICPGCGCPTNLYKMKKQPKPKASLTERYRSLSKQWKIGLIGIAAVVVLVIGFLVILFHRPNLTVKSFLKEIKNPFEAVLVYGLPNEIDDDGVFLYYNSIRFYGAKTAEFSWDPSDDGLCMIIDEDDYDRISQDGKPFKDLNRYYEFGEYYYAAQEGTSNIYIESNGDERCFVVFFEN